LDQPEDDFSKNMEMISAIDLSEQQEKLVDFVMGSQTDHMFLDLGSSVDSFEQYMEVFIWR